MLVTFTTKAYADITMFGDIAKTLLKMMGHSATVPGAILAAEVPVALISLQAAINAAPEAPAPAEAESEEPPVSLRTRALPLIDLLKSAARDEADVMWK